MVHVLQGSRVVNHQLPDRRKNIAKYATRWLEIKDYNTNEWETDIQVTPTPYGAIVNIVHTYTYEGAWQWTSLSRCNRNEALEEEGKRLNPFI